MKPEKPSAPAHKRVDPQLAAIIAAWRAAESAICVAMVTSLLPEIEVTYLEPEEGDSPPTP